MKAIKRINNNVCLCVDSKGNELIARGKGIGFRDFPYELDVKDIERTYYGVDETYVSMINDIPEDIIDIATVIVDKAYDTLDRPLSSNIVFTLADHINFTIQRYKKNMNIKLPIVYDIQYLFEKENDIGKFGLKLIKDRLNCWLPNEEASYIALHIINAEEKEKNEQALGNDDIISDITKMIEEFFNLTVNKENFNYSRFVSHMHYLLKRGKSKHLIETSNDKLFKSTKEEYPKTYECAESVSKYLNDKLKLELTDEEKLYLMLHINRLCTREECYQ